MWHKNCSRRGGNGRSKDERRRGGNAEMRYLKDERGLTFVELLAVILILGILVAAALPNYFGAENDARRAVDAANVRAINAALALYRFRNGSCPATQSAFKTFLEDTSYFPDGKPEDPIDGNNILPNQSGWTDYPEDYIASNCRLKRD